MKDAATDNKLVLETIIAEALAKLPQNKSQDLAWLEKPILARVRDFLYTPENYPELDSPRAKAAAASLLSFAYEVGHYADAQKDIREEVRIPSDVIADAAIRTLNSFRDTLKQAKEFRFAVELMGGAFRDMILTYVGQRGYSSNGSQLQANGT